MIEKLNILIDDDMGDDAALLLLNMAKDEIETERSWKYLTKIDTSQTAQTPDRRDQFRHCDRHPTRP